MTFSTSGTTITQTGTNSSLSGLESETGVTLLINSADYKLYYCTHKFRVNGTLTIDATKEKLLFAPNVSDEFIVNSSATFTYNLAQGSGSDTNYHNLCGLEFLRTSSTSDRTYNFRNQGTTVYNGGTIIGGSFMQLTSSSATATVNNLSIFINDKNWSTANREIRWDSDQGSIDGLTVDGANFTTWLNVPSTVKNILLKNIKKGAFATSGATKDLYPLTFDGYTGVNNTVDCTIYSDCILVMKNAAKGSDLKIRGEGSHSQNTGAVIINKDLQLKIKDGSGNVEGAKIYFKDYNHSNRVQFNSNYDWRDDRIYNYTTGSNGIIRVPTKTYTDITPALIETGLVLRSSASDLTQLYDDDISSNSNKPYFTNTQAVNRKSIFTIDLGRGVSKRVGRIIFYGNAGFGGTPPVAKLQVSDDKTTWTDKGSDFTFNPSTSGTLITIDNDTASRYIRIYGVSGSVTSSPYLRQLELYEASDAEVNRAEVLLGVASRGGSTGRSGTGLGSFNTGVNIIDVRGKNNTLGDDKFDVNIFSYCHKQATIELDLSGTGLTQIERALELDPVISEKTKATVDAYTDIKTAQQTYDKSKLWLNNNYHGEKATNLIERVDNKIEAKALNITFNGTIGKNTLAVHYSNSNQNLSIRSTSIDFDIDTTGTITFVNNAKVNGFVKGSNIETVKFINIPSGGRFKLVQDDSGTKTTLFDKTNITVTELYQAIKKGTAIEFLIESDRAITSNTIKLSNSTIVSNNYTINITLHIQQRIVGDSLRDNDYTFSYSANKIKIDKKAGGTHTKLSLTEFHLLLNDLIERSNDLEGADSLYTKSGNSFELKKSLDTSSDFTADIDLSLLSGDNIVSYSNVNVNKLKAGSKVLVIVPVASATTWMTILKKSDKSVLVAATNANIRAGLDENTDILIYIKQLNKKELLIDTSTGQGYTANPVYGELLNYDPSADISAYIKPGDEYWEPNYDTVNNILYINIQKASTISPITNTKSLFDYILTTIEGIRFISKNGLDTYRYQVDLLSIDSSIIKFKTGSSLASGAFATTSIYLTDKKSLTQVSYPNNKPYVPTKTNIILIDNKSLLDITNNAIDKYQTTDPFKNITTILDENRALGQKIDSEVTKMTHNKVREIIKNTYNYKSFTNTQHNGFSISTGNFGGNDLKTAWWIKNFRGEVTIKRTYSAPYSKIPVNLYISASNQYQDDTDNRRIIEIYLRIKYIDTAGNEKVHPTIVRHSGYLPGLKNGEDSKLGGVFKSDFTHIGIDHKASLKELEIGFITRTGIQSAEDVNVGVLEITGQTEEEELNLWSDLRQLRDNIIATTYKGVSTTDNLTFEISGDTFMDNYFTGHDVKIVNKANNIEAIRKITNYYTRMGKLYLTLERGIYDFRGFGDWDNLIFYINFTKDIANYEVNKHIDTATSETNQTVKHIHGRTIIVQNTLLLDDDFTEVDASSGNLKRQGWVFDNTIVKDGIGKKGIDVEDMNNPVKMTKTIANPSKVIPGKITIKLINFNENYSKKCYVSLRLTGNQGTIKTYLGNTGSVIHEGNDPVGQYHYGFVDVITSLSDFVNGELFKAAYLEIYEIAGDGAKLADSIGIVEIKMYELINITQLTKTDVEDASTDAINKNPELSKILHNTENKDGRAVADMVGVVLKGHMEEDRRNGDWDLRYGNQQGFNLQGSDFNLLKNTQWRGGILTRYYPKDGTPPDTALVLEKTNFPANTVIGKTFTISALASGSRHTIEILLTDSSNNTQTISRNNVFLPNFNPINTVFVVPTAWQTKVISKFKITFKDSSSRLNNVAIASIVFNGYHIETKNYQTNTIEFKGQAVELETDKNDSTKKYPKTAVTLVGNEEVTKSDLVYKDTSLQTKVDSIKAKTDNIVVTSSKVETFVKDIDTASTTKIANGVINKVLGKETATNRDITLLNALLKTLNNSNTTIGIVSSHASNISAIKTVTDKLRFTGNAVKVDIVAFKGDSSITLNSFKAATTTIDNSAIAVSVWDYIIGKYPGSTDIAAKDALLQIRSNMIEETTELGTEVLTGNKTTWKAGVLKILNKLNTNVAISTNIRTVTDKVNFDSNDNIYTSVKDINTTATGKIVDALLNETITGMTDSIETMLRTDYNNIKEIKLHLDNHIADITQSILSANVGGMSLQKAIYYAAEGKIFDSLNINTSKGDISTANIPNPNFHLKPTFSTINDYVLDDTVNFKVERVGSAIDNRLIEFSTKSSPVPNKSCKITKTLNNSYIGNYIYVVLGSSEEDGGSTRNVEVDLEFVDSENKVHTIQAVTFDITTRTGAGDTTIDWFSYRFELPKNIYLKKAKSLNIFLKDNIRGVASNLLRRIIIKDIISYNDISKSKDLGLTLFQTELKAGDYSKDEMAGKMILDEKLEIDEVNRALKEITLAKITQGIIDKAINIAKTGSPANNKKIEEILKLLYQKSEQLEFEIEGSDSLIKSSVKKGGGSSILTKDDIEDAVKDIDIGGIKLAPGLEKLVSAVYTKNNVNYMNSNTKLVVDNAISGINDFKATGFSTLTKPDVADAVIQGDIGGGKKFGPSVHRLESTVYLKNNVNYLNANIKLVNNNAVSSVNDFKAAVLTKADVTDAVLQGDVGGGIKLGASVHRLVSTVYTDNNVNYVNANVKLVVNTAISGLSDFKGSTLTVSQVEGAVKKMVWDSKKDPGGVNKTGEELTLAIYKSGNDNHTLLDKIDKKKHAEDIMNTTMTVKDLAGNNKNTTFKELFNKGIVENNGAFYYKGNIMAVNNVAVTNIDDFKGGVATVNKDDIRDAVKTTPIDNTNMLGETLSKMRSTLYLKKGKYYINSDLKLVDDQPYNQSLWKNTEDEIYRAVWLKALDVSDINKTGEKFLISLLQEMGTSNQTNSQNNTLLTQTKSTTDDIKTATNTVSGTLATTSSSVSAMKTKIDGLKLSSKGIKADIVTVNDKDVTITSFQGGVVSNVKDIVDAIFDKTITVSSSPVKYSEIIAKDREDIITIKNKSNLLTTDGKGNINSHVVSGVPTSADINTEVQSAINSKFDINRDGVKARADITGLAKSVWDYIITGSKASDRLISIKSAIDANKVDLTAIKTKTDSIVVRAGLVDARFKNIDGTTEVIHDVDYHKVGEAVGDIIIAVGASSAKLKDVISNINNYTSDISTDIFNYDVGIAGGKTFKQAIIDNYSKTDTINTDVTNIKNIVSQIQFTGDKYILSSQANNFTNGIKQDLYKTTLSSGKTVEDTLIKITNDAELLNIII